MLFKYSHVLSYFALLSSLVAAQSQPLVAGSAIKVNQTLQTPSNGVSTTPDGRLFLVYARVDGSKGPQVVEVHPDNTTTPFPNEEWNNYTEGADPATHLLRTNSQRIGPDGSLWIVDVGSPSFGAPDLLPYGPKLVKVNLTTNEVSRVYFLGNVTRSTSFTDDVRFNPAKNTAYLTDAGAPGIIVLDLETGYGVRVLDDDASTNAYIPVSAEGTFLNSPTGGFEYIYADQHEVSPDGKYYYYQPCSGGMSVVETALLDQALYNASISINSVLDPYVKPFAHTPSTGGTAIDAEGNIYLSNTDRQEILKIFPNGTSVVFLQDPRLLWVDAMWIDTQKRLWMPAAQLNRGSVFNNGTDKIDFPVYVYTVDLGIGPPAIDHP